MFGFFENLLQPTALPPEAPPPRDTGRALLKFYWHYARQARFLILALFVAGLATALMDTLIPVFIGRIVTLVSKHDPTSLLAEEWPQLLAMVLAMVIGRPLALTIRGLITNQAINPGLTNLTRWQSHWHVVRQSWSFFQNDFAGRIANRVMQTGPALRESIVSSINAVWYIIVYGFTALALMLSNDWWLTLPLLAWCVGYGCMLRYYVPRLRDRSRAMSEVRSALTGRIVDSYTNILTVKLFARARDEDSFVRESVDQHTAAFRSQLRMITRYILTLTAINTMMILGTAADAIVLWTHGVIAVGTVAMTLPLAWQIANISGWVADNITSIFENVGIVQDGMKSIAVPRDMADAPDAAELHVTDGAVSFENVTFGYGTQRGVLHGLSLDIAPGERIGLVGHSGAGKSTLVNLLLHFHAPDSGRIAIDGQDIAGVTQESLRTQIAMVTQDTSLLHRSIADNILYGRPDAPCEAMIAAAERAHAHAFVMGLADSEGRRGYDTLVGERGVKLSGGQRQRIAIARVLLKNAPILVLDEATSALDSEVEAAIQESLYSLMEGKTVIAIAHRLSTIAAMDRLIVLDCGQIVETGTHRELLERDRLYASLWRRQSGGFLREDAG